MNTALAASKQEPEYKETPPLAISSLGTENTKKNSSRLPYGSALLTDTGSSANSLKNEGITHIVHAAMMPLGSDEAAFIKVATLAIQNSIFLVEREKVDTKLATCFLGGNIYCPVEAVKPRLAEAIIRAALCQLKECSYLQEVIFVDFDGNYYKDARKKIESGSDCPANIGKAKVVEGKPKPGPNLLHRSLHGAGVIVNSENAEMNWGGGVSESIWKALGAEEKGKIGAERYRLRDKFNSLIKEGDNGGNDNSAKISRRAQKAAGLQPYADGSQSYIFFMEDDKSLEIDIKHPVFKNNPPSGLLWK